MLRIDAADRMTVQAALRGRSAGFESGAAAAPDAAIGRVMADLRGLGLVRETAEGSPALAETGFGQLARPLILEMYSSLAWIQSLPVPLGAPFAATVACVQPSPAALGSTTAPGGARIVSGCAASLAEATLRCIAEGVERWALQFAPEDEQRSVLATEPPGALPVAELLPRAWLNANPQSLSNGTARRWLAAKWTSDGSDRLVPAAHVLLGYPGRAGEGWPPSDTSGAACGGSFEDATGRALFELIERDAVGIWWHGRTVCAGLDIPSLHDPWIDAANDWLWAHGRCLWFLDISTDLGVPVVVAASCDRNHGRLIIGTAAGVTPVEAARAALAEHFLMLLNVQAIEKRAPDMRAERSAATKLLRWHLQSSPCRQPHLFPDAAATWPRRPRRRRVADVIARLRARGYLAMSFRCGRLTPPLVVARCVVPRLATREYCPDHRSPVQRRTRRLSNDDETFPY